MSKSLKPRPKIAAAGKTAGGLTLAGVVALLLGASPDDPLVQAVAGALLAFLPVIAGYFKKDGAS